MLDFVCQVLTLGSGVEENLGNLWESIWWRTDGEYAPVTFFVNCNDLFAWACADAEKIQTELEVLALRTAVGDVREALGLPRGDIGKDFHDAAWDKWWDAGGIGAMLFCARKRGMRPQRAWFKDWAPEVVELFLSCGPERDRKTEG